MNKQCPFCKGPLETLRRETIPNTTSLWCENCKVELIRYSGDNKKGVQRTGLYALIPLAQFAHWDWFNFIDPENERNIYGERIPDRMPIFSCPEEKAEVESERERILQKRREWEEQVS